MKGTGRGAFILFEGIDRCGKSTQTQLLGNFLQLNILTEIIRFPNRTSCIGQLINSYLTSTTDMNDQTIHLLFSANRWEASREIEAKLSSGYTLVCDRYAYSGVSFSSAKGLDLAWCKSCDSGLPAPDCVIFLDMPVDAASERGNYGEERYEKVDFQLKVQAKMSQLQEMDKGVIPWFRLDARKTKEELHEEIKAISLSVIEEVKLKPIARIWPVL